MAYFISDPVRIDPTNLIVLYILTNTLPPPPNQTNFLFRLKYYVSEHFNFYFHRATILWFQIK